jgi:hypothetical protein
MAITEMSLKNKTLAVTNLLEYKSYITTRTTLSQCGDQAEIDINEMFSHTPKAEVFKFMLVYHRSHRCSWSHRHPPKGAQITCKKR